MEVLGIKNGSSGLNGITGDIDGGHATSDDAVSFEHSDGEIGTVVIFIGIFGGVETEKVSYEEPPMPLPIIHTVGLGLEIG